MILYYFKRIRHAGRNCHAKALLFQKRRGRVSRMLGSSSTKAGGRPLL